MILPNSSPIINPIMVITRAASLVVIGIVIVGIVCGLKMDVIISPKIILPQASRLMAAFRLGSFSSIGGIGFSRGSPEMT